MIRDPGYYQTFNKYLRSYFNEKVYKVTLDAGFSCPNREQGAGCIYCDSQGSGNGRHASGMELREQIEKGMAFARKRYKANKFIAYFQAYSNTYAPIEILEERYRLIEEYPDIVALAVGTRPDCIDEPVLELLSSFSDRYQVWLELGIQSANDQTLKFINRGHDWQTSLDAVKMVSKYPLMLCLHFVLGLPYDSVRGIKKAIADMLEIGFHGIKLHNLYITEDAPIYKLFERNEIDMISYENYLQAIVEIIEMLPQTVIIQRLIGETHPSKLVAPDWSAEKRKLLADVVDSLKKRNSFQGRLHKYISKGE